jgi:prevent-host-death family protein
MEINIYAAKTQLSRLVEQVKAGEEVVITRRGKPVAKLIPVGDELPERKLGQLKGKVWMSDDFDDPLPDDLLDLFEGKVKEEGTEWPWGCSSTPTP